MPLYVYVSDMVISVSSTFKPLSGSNLNEMNSSMLYSTMIRESSLFVSFSRINNGLAKSIYGLAHCCQDLLYFIKIPADVSGNSAIIKIRRNEISTSTDESSHMEMNFSGTTIRFDIPVDDVMYKSSLKLNPLPDVYSGMKFNSYKAYLKDTFDIDFRTERCDVNHSVTAETQTVTQTSIDSKASSSSTARRMAQLSAVVPDRTYSLNNNKPLIDSIIGLVKFCMLHKGDEFEHDRHMLFNYVYSSICLHVKNVGKFDSSSSLEDLKIDIKITFGSNNYNSNIVDAVDNCKFMPISSLHWLLYGDHVSIDD